MAEKVKGRASYFPSIEKKYGRPVDEGLRLIRQRPRERHMQLVNWLKTEYGLGHGHANAPPETSARHSFLGDGVAEECSGAVPVATNARLLARYRTAASLVLMAVVVMPAEPLALDRRWSEAMQDMQTPLLTDLALVFNALGRVLGKGAVAHGGRRLDELHEPVDHWLCDADNKQGRAESNQAAGKHVGRVVGTDEDAASPDRECGGEEDAGRHAVEHKDGEGDPEGGARVVAGKGRIVGTAAQLSPQRRPSATGHRDAFVLQAVPLRQSRYSLWTTSI